MSQNEQTEILREMLKWIKVSSYREVKDFLNSILDTDTKKIIYQHSDGNRKRSEVVKSAESSAGAVFNCWKEWKKLGIGETVNVPGGDRFKRTFDLADFGLLPDSFQQNSKIKSKGEEKLD